MPPFVRASLASLGVPGCKILRWENRTDPLFHFLDPAAFPATSAAMTGTHDTETLASWWEHASWPERVAQMQVSTIFATRGVNDPGQSWNAALRDALIELAYGAGSADLFFPIQDLFGWHDRINAPATIGEWNWTWRLPWAVDKLSEVPEAVERAEFCRALAGRTGRGGKPEGSKA